MTGPSDTLTLTTRLALLSSISFGGFPTVLPDVRDFVVANHGWLTDQEFSNLFALAQAIPGPNMILMMSFVGWQVWGLPGAIASAFATFYCKITFLAVTRSNHTSANISSGMTTVHNRLGAQSAAASKSFKTPRTSDHDRRPEGI